jgi:hypothetical protein
MVFHCVAKDVCQLRSQLVPMVHVEDNVLYQWNTLQSCCMKIHMEDKLLYEWRNYLIWKPGLKLPSQLEGSIYAPCITANHG